MSTTEPVEDFDLDAALEDAATNTPDEWKGKVGKIQSEVKGLRERSKPYTERFSDLDDNTRESLFTLVDLIKQGSGEDVSKWLLSSAKNISGDKFTDLVGELTPAQQEAVAEAVEDAVDDGETLSPAKVQAMIADAIKSDREASTQQASINKQMQVIEDSLKGLGYDPQSRESRQVLQIARDETKGDITKAHEAFLSWKADLAKEYLKSKQGEPTLLDDNATPATQETNENLTPAERIRRRLASTTAAGA